MKTGILIHLYGLGMFLLGVCIALPLDGGLWLPFGLGSIACMIAAMVIMLRESSDQ